MTLLSAAEWGRVLAGLGCSASICSTWCQVFEYTVKEDTFKGGMPEVQAFLGQILHESGHLTHVVEDLNYSAERLMVVWPRRFPLLAAAQPYAHQPQKLANFVYGGRGGNYLPDDGWTFRARGPLEVTFRSNYVLMGDLMGQDLTVSPQLLEQPYFGLESAVRWWNAHIPASAIGDVVAQTLIINGGQNGLDDRRKLVAKAAEVLSTA